MMPDTLLVTILPFLGAATSLLLWSHPRVVKVAHGAQFARVVFSVAKSVG
ncbi:MAG: hypothetical protein ACREII_08140 [Nitrospiraceae bacterium]